MSEDKPSDDIIDVEPQVISDSAMEQKPKLSVLRFGKWGALGLLALACAAPCVPR